MSEPRFEWDRSKAFLNKRKHRILFEEAQTVFNDEHAIEYFDPDHSEREDRFVILGLSDRLRLLVVSYCVRRDQSVIRVITARKADRQESADYKEANR